jgi:hypothetical protein
MGREYSLSFLKAGYFSCAQFTILYRVVPSKFSSLERLLPPEHAGKSLLV